MLLFLFLASQKIWPFFGYCQEKKNRSIKRHLLLLLCTWILLLLFKISRWGQKNIIRWKSLFLLMDTDIFRAWMNILGRFVTQKTSLSCQVYDKPKLLWKTIFICWWYHPYVHAWQKDKKTFPCSFLKTLITKRLTTYGIFKLRSTTVY